MPELFVQRRFEVQIYNTKTNKTKDKYITEEEAKKNLEIPVPQALNLPLSSSIGLLLVSFEDFIDNSEEAVAIISIIQIAKLRSLI